MCKFCYKHGGGKKWYLNERNLSVKLAKELGYEVWELDHWKLIDKVYGDAAKTLSDVFDDPNLLEPTKKMIEAMIQKDEGTRVFPEGHLGQVITVEEAKKVVESDVSLPMDESKRESLHVYAIGVTWRNSKGVP
ncbi:MAG: hypothetical protein QXF77_00915 [Candidatus Jordarchaeales archaeon]